MVTILFALKLVMAMTVTITMTITPENGASQVTRV